MVVHGRAEGQRRHRADTRDTHQATTDLVVAGRHDHQAMQAITLARQRLTDLQERLEQHHPSPPAPGELAGTGREGSLANRAHLPSKATQQATHAMVDVAQLADREPARGEECPQLPGSLGLDVDRPEPSAAGAADTSPQRRPSADGRGHVRTICAIARASARSVLTGLIPVAARSCRVSSSSTGKPAAFSSA